MIFHRKSADSEVSLLDEFAARIYEELDYNKVLILVVNGGGCHACILYIRMYVSGTWVKDQDDLMLF